MHPIFLRSISWSIVSRAFDKSISIQPVYFPDSKPSFILSVNFIVPYVWQIYKLEKISQVLKAATFLSFI